MADEIARVMAVLDEHRWKSMGVNTAQCECGEILIEPTSSLVKFPADEAFRRHIAERVVADYRPGGESRG